MTIILAIYLATYFPPFLLVSKGKCTHLQSQSCQKTYETIHPADLQLPHLCLSQHKRSGHLEALRSGQVLAELELVL